MLYRSHAQHRIDTRPLVRPRPPDRGEAPRRTRTSRDRTPDCVARRNRCAQALSRRRCSSLFTYCTQVPHLSEHAAYGRIEAARAARQFPIILDLLADGSVTLTAVCLVKPHLTAENHREQLEAARHKSKRDVEHLIARVHPQPPVPSAVRRLPSPKLPNNNSRLRRRSLSFHETARRFELSPPTSPEDGHVSSGGLAPYLRRTTEFS